MHTLILCHNRLEGLPDELFMAPVLRQSLVNLDFSSNRLRALPAGILSLSLSLSLFLSLFLSLSLSPSLSLKTFNTFSRVMEMSK